MESEGKEQEGKGDEEKVMQGAGREKGSSKGKVREGLMGGEAKRGEETD